MMESSPNVAECQNSLFRRRTTPPLPELRETYASQVHDFEELLSIEITDFQDSALHLGNFAKTLKSTSKSMFTISRELTSRLNKVGSIDECQRVRSQRLNFQKEVQEILNNINVLLSKLGLDKLSSFDDTSVRSGFSLSSQLSPCTSVP